MSKFTPKKLTFAAGVLYLLSLFFPVFIFAEGDSTFIMGFVCLLFGWGWDNLAWFANPPLWLAHRYLFKDKRLAAVGCIAVAVGFALLAFGIRNVPRDESGRETAIEGFHVGFYLWQLSIFVSAAGMIYFWLKRHRDDAGDRDSPDAPNESTD